jgi:hypothetical protein
MVELRREELSDPGLSTADLANLDEQTSAKRNVSQLKERDRAESQQPESRAEDAEALQNETAPLFSPEEAKGFHTRWDAIQVSFVDEPRRAVQQADGLVASAMKRLAEIFAEERGQLDHQWDRGDDVSTEDLRIALRRYRSFFGRLLSV